MQSADSEKETQVALEAVASSPLHEQFKKQEEWLKARAELEEKRCPYCGGTGERR